MSRRIDIELTSDRGDGSWTWRAAGAREPRGVVDATLVPDGTKVGQILRADADFDLDGVSIVALAPIQDKKRNEAERIEVIGAPHRDQELVTSSLVKGGRGERGERERRDRRPDEAARRERPDRRERADARERSDGRDRGERPERPRAAGRRPPRPRPGGAAEAQAEAPPAGAGASDRPSSRNCRPSTARSPSRCSRATSPRCGRPSTRRTRRRKERGRAAIDGTELLALAEKLRPRLRTAEWRDRAEAALADVDEIDLRDLRSVVVAADSAARDDETRALAAQLRESLARRVDSEQASWLQEITSALDSGRAVRALRLELAARRRPARSSSPH